MIPDKKDHSLNSLKIALIWMFASGMNRRNTGTKKDPVNRAQKKRPA